MRGLVGAGLDDYDGLARLRAGEGAKELLVGPLGRPVLLALDARPRRTARSARAGHRRDGGGGSPTRSVCRRAAAAERQANIR